MDLLLRTVLTRYPNNPQIFVTQVCARIGMQNVADCYNFRRSLPPSPPPLFALPVVVE